MRAIGVREIAAYVRGEIDRAEAIAPASRRPGNMPSANIPGSTTSRRPSGRASSCRLEQDTIGTALELLSASA